MKVTQVALRPTEQSNAANRPALTPELLAASGARYSRNNEGLEAILSKIDPGNLDKSVDSIFTMIDYGHQSIADMVPVAMFIDEISIWLAYYVWTLCPTAAGQESSTRYIKLSVGEMLPPELLGIPPGAVSQWRATMNECFAAYYEALSFWETLATGTPDLVRIPRALLEDPSEKAQRRVARMKRNYAFDRSRYFLPVAASTNMMLLMSARGWVRLCQYLLSHPAVEARALGELIRPELELSAPRMSKHAVRQTSTVDGLEKDFQNASHDAIQVTPAHLLPGSNSPDAAAVPFLEVTAPAGVADPELKAALEFHSDRYAWVGDDLARTVVRFGWSAVAFAEIRDLNRHRTGTKYCRLIPTGFYSAPDQIPSAQRAARRSDTEHHRDLSDVGRRASLLGLEHLARAEASYVYWTVLGTQYPFEHVTTADKFLYEAELRTGTGAHFRYAQHFRNLLAEWYGRFPGTRGFVIEGSAEPE